MGSRRSASRHWSCLLALCIGTFVACGESGVGYLDAGSGSPTAGSESRAARRSVNIAQPAEVAHRGVRRVEIFDEFGALSLAYRESVASDGVERFSLRPLETLTPVAQDWILLQVNREGYLFRYRDFAVRNVAWLLANYEIGTPEADEPIAGREVEKYRIERRKGEELAFEVWVDRELRLPLRIEELGPKNVLRSRSSYESLETAPDFTDVIWFQRAYDGQTLDPTSDLAGQLGYPVPTPRLLPAGYRLLEAATLEDPRQSQGRPWVRLVYSDGAGTFFFLHQAPEAEAHASLPAEPGVLAASPAGVAGDLLLHRMGAAGVAQATLAEGTFIAVGKVTDDELVDAIESALP